MPCGASASGGGDMTLMIHCFGFRPAFQTGGIFIFIFCPPLNSCVHSLPELCILNQCDEQTLPFEAGLRSPRVRWRPCGPAGPRTLRGGAWRCEGPAGLVGPHAAVLGTRRPSRSPGLRRDGLISTRGQCVKVSGVLGASLTTGTKSLIVPECRFPSSGACV